MFWKALQCLEGNTEGTLWKGTKVSACFHGATCEGLLTLAKDVGEAHGRKWPRETLEEEEEWDTRSKYKRVGILMTEETDEPWVPACSRKEPKHPDWIIPLPSLLGQKD